MKRRIHRILPLAIATLLLIASDLLAARVTILSPARNRYVESEQLNLVLAFPDGDVTSVQVVAGGKTYTKPVPGGKGQACLAITLQNGLNQIEIRAIDRTGKLTVETLPIYLRSGLSKQYQTPPAGYERYFFHSPANENACSGCHRMEVRLTDLNPGRLEDSPCYVCHKHTGQAIYRHQPVAAGACFSCHEAANGVRKYATKKPDRQTCFVCHSAQSKQWKTMKLQHGPTAVGNCTVCHNPHGSDWPSFVSMHPTDLCLNCHQDKKSGSHVIAGFFAKGHPVKAASNPLKRDRPFSCAGCHNPHAGDSQSLLNRDRSSLAVYCQSCHKL